MRIMSQDLATHTDDLNLMIISKVKFLFIACFLIFGVFANSFAFTLSGKVMGGSNALSGAKVEIKNADSTANFSPITVTTSSTGAYSFAINSAGTYNITVTPSDLTTYAISRVSAQISTQDVVQDILLLPVVGQLTGTVSFPDGKAAANVTLTVKKTVTDVGVNVVTNALGKYAIGLPSGNYLIGVSDCTTGYLSGGCWFDTAYVSSFAFSADAVKNFSLPYVKLTGKTKASDNSNATGVTVVVAAQALTSATTGGSAALQGGTNAVSDSSGSFTLGLPAGTGYQISMTDSQGRTYLKSGVSVTTSTSLELALKGYSLSGVITTVNSYPAEGVLVTLKPTAGGSAFSTYTDKDGKYFFGVESGTFILGLSDCSMQTLNNSCWWDDAYIQNIQMTSSKTLDIKLPYVLVIANTTNASGAVGGVKVVTGAKTLSSVAGGTSGLTDGTNLTSDSSGAVALVLPAASGYTVGMSVPGVGNVLLTNQNFTPASGSTYMVTDLSTVAAMKLSGKITFPDGTAAAGVNLSVGLYGNSSNFTFPTDSTGSYSLGLSSGSYDIGLSDCTNLFLSGGCWFDTKYISGLSVSTSTVKNIALPYARLTGKTTDRNGVYVPSVEISASFSALTSANAGGIAQMTAGTKVVSDDSGNYALSLPIASNYKLLISPIKGSNFNPQTLDNFQMTASKQQTIVLPYTDTTPPIIVSGPIFRAVNATDAIVEWQTDKPTTGSVSGGATAATSSNLATLHSVHLTGLTAGKSYTIIVSATDEFNNGPTTKSGTLVTASAVVVKAPVILMGPSATTITKDGMVVEWVTNIPSKGTVQYGPNSFASTASESAFSIVHKVTLSGLQANTTYQIRVTATELTGAQTTTSRTITAQTLPSPDTSPPVIVSGPLITNVRDTSVSVIWVTDEPSVSGVSWNSGGVHGLVTDTNLSTTHMQHITGLKANTTYNLTVSSTDGLGNGPSLSKTVQFKTLPGVVTVVPVLPQILSPQEVTSVTNTTAMVMWGTDLPSTSEVSYGTSKSSLTSTETRSQLVTQHSVPLVGLSPGTTYYVQVKSVDAKGNASVNTYTNTFTGDTSVSFVTLANPVTTAPVFQTPPQVGYATSNAAVIGWVTGTAADTVVTVTNTNTSFAEPPKVGVDANLNATHQLALTGLTPNSTYSVAVTSTDISGNKATTTVADFSTPPSPDTGRPLISNAPTVEAKSTMATVSWVTDKLSDSKVSYGAGSSSTELLQSSGDVSFAKNHKVVLANLTPSTVYQVRVTSTDLSGNTSLAQTASFTTNAAGNDTAATTGGGTATTTNTTSTTTTVTSTTTTTGAATTSASVAMSSVSLVKGWNLIGNGLDQTINAATVFSDKTKFTTVWKWIASTSKWAFYAPSLASADLATYAQGKGYDVLSSISAGDGFWVNAAQATTVNLQRTTSAVAIPSSSFGSSGNRPLVSGWSLIATGDNKAPADFNLALSDTPPAAGATTPINLTTLWAWDSAQSNWFFYAPSLSSSALTTYAAGKGYQVFGSKVLSPSMGFWVNKP